MIETKPITTTNTDDNEFKDHLKRIPNEELPPTPVENMVNTPLLKPFACPDFVLNFLQDKPIKVQQILLTSKLTTSEKKEVADIFTPNEHELKINREAMKFLIEKLATKYPEMQPFLGNETIFFGTFAFGIYDRAEAVKTTLEISRSKKTTGVI